MFTMEIPDDIRAILNGLDANGYEAFIVGGCVRDAIIGKTPHDYDICTSATPEQIKAVFGETIQTIQKGNGEKFGTVIVGNGQIEVTTYRCDGQYSDGRHPDEVAFSTSLEEDLKRRDFTMNAMAYNEKVGLVDMFGGEKDMHSGVIRCVGDPNKRFEEDALRIMRAIRFESTLGMAAEKSMEKAMKENVHRLEDVSPERKFTEIQKTLMGDSCCYALLKNKEIIGNIIPAIKPCIGFEQNNTHHIYDVYDHMVMSLANATPDPDVRLALLLHDIGKPACYKQTENGIGHFYGHEEVSAEIARSILRDEFHASNATINKACLLIEKHGFFFDEVNKRRVARLVSEIGTEDFEKLARVCMCDVKAQNPAHEKKNLENIDRSFVYLEELEDEKTAFTLKDLAVNGRDAIEAGYEGCEIGKTLHRLLHEVVDGNIKYDRESLLTAMGKNISINEDRGHKHHHHKSRDNDDLER